MVLSRRSENNATLFKYFFNYYAWWAKYITVETFGFRSIDNFCELLKKVS